MVDVNILYGCNGSIIKKISVGTSVSVVGTSASVVGSSASVVGASVSVVGASASVVGVSVTVVGNSVVVGEQDALPFGTHFRVIGSKTKFSGQYSI